MKKLLVCMLMTGLMMPAVAQKDSDVIIDGWTIAGTSNSYDRQTQGSVYPMTKQHDDGFIGCTWTNEDNAPFAGSNNPTRGVGYSYSTNNGQTWSTQEKRVGGIPLYWPSYAQWGANGEAILARSSDTHVYQGVQIKNGLVLLTRPNKGQGEWTIHTVPYPAGTPLESGYVMAWSRMVTSGENHQYIQIMTHTRLEGQYYQGYHEPVFYYRTSDGGATWDHAGILVPEIAGMEWDKNPENPQFTDNISFAQHGDVIAASFINFGYHAYVLKSVDNGDTWTAIKFFDASARYHGHPSEYADECYIPTHGCVAVDNNGKVHIAFGTRMVKNLEEPGYISVYTGFSTSFLSYWNEDMAPLNAGDDFNADMIGDLIYDKFIDMSLSSDGQLYVKSATPVWPIVGFYAPGYGNYFTIPDQANDFDWLLTSYGHAGLFSFPQMAFDRDNTLHLTYLGMLSGGGYGNGPWYRHPYYTVTAGGAIWGETKYLVNDVNLIDQEFAYLTLAGVDNNTPKQWIHLMAQVDPYAGTYTPYSNSTSDHSATTNKFYHFRIQGDEVEACNAVTNLEVNYTADCSKAELTWNAPERGNFTYKIYRDGSLIKTINNETSYTDQGFSVAKHTWKVTVVCGTGESLPSGVTKGACTPCNPVTDASATITNCETATITWKAVAGAKGYKILRDGNLLATVTTTEYTETAEFEYETSYTWQIVTICAENESGEVEVTAMCICNSVTDIKTEVDCKTATITWKAVESAVGYNIVRDGIGIIHSVTVPKYTENDTFEDGETYKWKIETLCVNGGVSDSVEATAVADCVNINELADHVAIYPNPTTGMITIEVAEFLKVEIYNPVGQLIEIKSVNTFDVSSYNTGIYFFKVYTTNNNSVTKRVMVTK